MDCFRKSPVQDQFYIFEDRVQVAELLAGKLSQYSSNHPLVLGISRDSVPIAKVIANSLDGDLDIALIHNIQVTEDSPFDLRSVTEFGTLLQSKDLKSFKIDQSSLDHLSELESVKIKVDRRTYTPTRSALSPTQRTVILVDDGLSDDIYLFAIVRAIRMQNPSKIIVASPIASTSVQLILKKEIDALVLLNSEDEPFRNQRLYHEAYKICDNDLISLFGEDIRVKEREKSERIIHDLEVVSRKF